MNTPLLAPFAGIYYLGLLLDRRLKSRKAVTLPKPVISIGNLTWGGTGKTPTLLKLVSDLVSHKIRPAILTRGYKGGAQSDEVRLMAQKFPHVPIGVGPNRVESTHNLITAHQLDAFVLDDGFQHWKIKRNLDIVCVDATDPWGGGHLIPWGRLREPKKELKRSQAVVVTRAELVSSEELKKILDEIARLVEHKNVFTARFTHELYTWKGKKADLGSTLKGTRVLAVSAIGNPRSFEENLKVYGAEVVPFRFPDHYPYSDRDLDQIEKKAKEIGALIVVTEKDEVKLRGTRLRVSQSGPVDLYVLHAAVQFPFEEETKWSRMIDEFTRR